MKVDKKNPDAEKPREEDKDLFVTCFTDASFCPESGAWGIAFWLKHGMTDKPIVKSKGGKVNPKSTNSTKIEAQALEYAKDYICEECMIHDKVIVIQSDCLSALEQFSENPFKKKGARFVKKKHVKAHTSNKTRRTSVNRIVDREAKKQMRKYRDEM